MATECYYIIKNKYEKGVYNLKRMVELVDKNILSKQEFQFITSYSYDALKKSRGW